MNWLEHVRVGDNLWRVMDGLDLGANHLWRFTATVTDIDNTTITCTVYTDVPRTMKFSSSTGIHEYGDTCGWLEMKEDNMNIQLMIIDPQIDFMDLPGSALPVSGANEDMNRLAAMLNRVGGKLSDIHVTMDSHDEIDIAHPGFWIDGDGNHPSPFTLITNSDVSSGIWRPRSNKLLPRVLDYTSKLESSGKYMLCIWPPHCLIGSVGHTIQPRLRESLKDWCTRYFATINFIAKGSNPFTEHYGAIMAEVPDNNDPSTMLNSRFIKVLKEADMIVVAGEALSHCVKVTMEQVANEFGEDLYNKFYLLTDAMSPVGQAPGGPDFPEIGKEFLRDMSGKGMNLTTTLEFLA